MNPTARAWPASGAVPLTDLESNGRFSLRPIIPGRDCIMLHAWFASDRGYFWSMPDKSVPGIFRYYAQMQQHPHERAFLGLEFGRPAFVIECYDPELDRVGSHYDVMPGDLGMHLFVAPPTWRVPHFTHDVFRAAMRFMFGSLGAARIVVEPDIRNTRIHRLNRHMGFHYLHQIRFPEKEANLAICTHQDFKESLTMELLS